MVTLPNFPFIFIMGGGGFVVFVAFTAAVMNTPWKDINSRKAKITWLVTGLTFAITSCIVMLNALDMVGKSATIQAETVEKAYGIEIENGWPETRIAYEWPASERDKETEFLITYNQDGETLEGKVVVDKNLETTVYSLTTGDPIPLASE